MQPGASRARRPRRAVWLAALAYIALTIALTWPLARGLARDVPGDFGDPLLNMWILAWDAGHLGNFDAPIFAPHRHALAYSEHLTAQAVVGWPVYAATRNPILTYNVLFLATFAGSALGAFLLARDLTGNSGAAFVAGLAFGFAPYRFSTLPHLQVLSSAWMPFALLGFRRYFATGSLTALCGGAVAWLAQNLSCAYYLLFFTPILALYVGWEMTVRRLWTDARVLKPLAVAALAVVCATAPFVWPYMALRRSGFNARSIGETQKYSADVYAYFTADPSLRVWAAVARVWPHAEGALFPGATIALLALAAIVLSWDLARGGAPYQSTRTARALGWLFPACAATTSLLLLGWTLRVPAERPLLKVTSFSRSLLVSTAVGALWLISSARARYTARKWLRSPAAIFTFIAVAAVALSFGPAIFAQGRLVTTPSVYAAFYELVPGFDGLRVPARFAMIVALGLAVLAAYGAALITRARATTAAVVVSSVLIVVESIAVPLPINQNDTNYRQHGLAALPARVFVGSATPPVYVFARALPPTSVLLELPLGEPAFDVRYMFYAIGHKRPLVNGYSGGAPDDYSLLAETLRDIRTRPDDAWRAVMASAATHVVVHEPAYARDGPAITSWIRHHGAREIGAFDGDYVFQIR
jgi:hypothetical protein